MMDEATLRSAIETLRRAPGLVKEATSGLPAPRHAWKPSPKEFSILENVAHLHDIEREGYLARVRRILEEEMPRLPDIDGERLAIERRYNARDLGVEVAAFAAARTETLAILERTSAGLLGRQGELENVGIVTLEKLIGMMAEHDLGHLRDIRSVRERAGV